MLNEDINAFDCEINRVMREIFLTKNKSYELEIDGKYLLIIRHRLMPHVVTIYTDGIPNYSLQIIVDAVKRFSVNNEIVNNIEEIYVRNTFEEKSLNIAEPVPTDYGIKIIPDVRNCVIKTNKKEPPLVINDKSNIAVSPKVYKL